MFAGRKVKNLAMPRRRKWLVHYCLDDMILLGSRSLLPVFGVRISVMFHLMLVHIVFSSVWVASSGHFLGKSCPLPWSFVLFVFCLFVILVISRFVLVSRGGFGFWLIHFLVTFLKYNFYGSAERLDFFSGRPPGGACWSTVYRCVNKRPQNLP